MTDRSRPSHYSDALRLSRALHSVGSVDGVSVYDRLHTGLSLREEDLDLIRDVYRTAATWDVEFGTAG